MRDALWMGETESALGPLAWAMSERGLRVVALTGGLSRLGEELATVPRAGTPPAEAAWLAWLAAYARGEEAPLPPLDPVGTAFDRAVWRALTAIPFGGLLSYGEVARAVGTGSARAVGGAVGRNPLPLVVPCHRVVMAERRLGGFSGGLDIKRRLLTHEGWLIEPHATPMRARLRRREERP